MSRSRYSPNRLAEEEILGGDRSVPCGVEQARQLAGQARSLYYPGVGYASVLSYGDNQFLGSPTSDTADPQGFFLGIVRATWEVDLWGRIRRTNEAAPGSVFRD